MGSSTKSQLEKWEAKYAQNERDIQAMVKSERESKSGIHAPGMEDLAKAGNIKEAAVVFSREGMSMFANMFGNTMERIVEDAIEKRVSNIIEKKMFEMMQGMQEGMIQGMEAVSQNLLKGFDVPKETEQPEIQVDIEKTAMDKSLAKVDKAEAVLKALESPIRVEPVIEDKPEHTVNIAEQKEADEDRELKFTRKTVGAKKIEIEKYVPMFAEVVRKAPGRVTLKRIIDTVEAEHNVRFNSPGAIAGVMLERYPDIIKPERGFYIQKR
jgi:hypothetical protein